MSAAPLEVVVMNRKLRKLLLFGAAGAAAMAFLLVGCAPAQAQLRLKNVPGVGQRRATPPPATTQNPDRVRNLLLAIHGFSYNELQAASTDADAILRGFIDDPAESMTVRRQAVKGLRHYPSEENFAFIQTRLDGAPAGLKQLYILSLAGFGGTHHDEIVDMVGPLLADPDVGVRDATVVLCGRLNADARLRALLENRLPEESEAGVRKAINRVLGR